MEDTKGARAAKTSREYEAPQPPRWRAVLKWFGVVTLVLFCVAAGAAIYINGKFNKAKSFGDFLAGIDQTRVAIVEPTKFFPGEDRINVLCLGLDRNIFRSRDPKLNGMPYTKGSRSDVMMIASLDLRNQTASILSIPRDTRVQLPGKRSFAKINQAHADGGVEYTQKTVEEFLGITIDHHVVIKQEAIEKVVDALGGINVDVPMDMDYDDSWGQLHIHLKEGKDQHLMGEQIVGFMRFRHGDPEGDIGRIKRQQQVIQELSQKAKDPATLLQAVGLIDAIQKYVQTDLTPQQQLALAHLFHKVDQSNIQAVALPTEGTDTIGGINYVIPDEYGKEAAVDWIIHGNKDAMNRLIKVEVKNASGDKELGDKVADCLRHYGFEVSRGGRASGDPKSSTRIVQLSKMRGAARRVREVLGSAPDVEKEDGEPWGPDVAIYVGKDLETSQTVTMSDLWPETPERPARRRTRTVRTQRDNASVRIRTVDPDESSNPKDEEQPPADQNLDVPGTADPSAPTEGVTPGSPAPAAPAGGTTPPGDSKPKSPEEAQ